MSSNTYICILVISDNFFHLEMVSDIVSSCKQVMFDCMQAKLPKGIEKIRPHIENVDNVPLQVSLFTDCTPASEYSTQCQLKLKSGHLAKVHVCVEGK